MKSKIICLFSFLMPFIIGHIWYKDDASFYITIIVLALSTIFFIIYFSIGIRKRNAYLILSLPIYVISFFLFIKIINIQYANSENNASKIITRLEHYKKEKGSYPTNLSILEPKYLSNVPKIWFGFFSENYLYRYDAKDKSFSLAIQFRSKPNKIWESSLGQWQFLD
jgi:hypothetical protein